MDASYLVESRQIFIKTRAGQYHYGSLLKCTTLPFDMIILLTNVTDKPGNSAIVLDKPPAYRAKICGKKINFIPSPEKCIQFKMQTPLIPRRPLEDNELIGMLWAMGCRSQSCDIEVVPKDVKPKIYEAF